MRVAGADDDAHVGHVPAQAGDRAQPHRARSEHGDHGPVHAADHRQRQQRGVDAGGGRFDQHRLLVRHVIGHAVELGLVSDELGRPTAAGRAAEAGLDAGLERSGGEMGVVVAVARRSTLERRCEASRLVPEHRLDDHPRAIVEQADDLVAGYERERDPVVEVDGRVALDGREVAAADAGEQRAHAVPARAGQRGWVVLHELERAESCRHGRAHRRHEPGERELGRLAIDPQRLHRRATELVENRWRSRSLRIGPIGSSGRGPPGAFSQCSTSQPRLRAIAARRVSGFTTTGKPTASSSGRSDVESA